MKKIFSIVMTLISLSVFAQQTPTEGPDQLLFSMTIKSLNLSSPAEMNALIEGDAWLILDGSLSSLTLKSARDEEYLLEALLVQGEWMGLDQVLKYECKLVFQGEYWRDIVPDRAPRDVQEGMILLNSHVMVLGKIIGFEQSDSRLVPYMAVSQVRIVP